jgi:hypothetical protein
MPIPGGSASPGVCGREREFLESRQVAAGSAESYMVTQPTPPPRFTFRAAYLSRLTKKKKTTSFTARRRQSGARSVLPSLYTETSCVICRLGGEGGFQVVPQNPTHVGRRKEAVEKTHTTLYPMPRLKPHCKLASSVVSFSGRWSKTRNPRSGCGQVIHSDSPPPLETRRNRGEARW